MSTDNDDGGWREELIEAVHALVRDAVTAEALREIDLPHIVICRDPETGVASYTGPYRDGLEALIFAERESERDLEFNPDGAMKFEVSALFPVENVAPEQE